MAGKTKDIKLIVRTEVQKALNDLNKTEKEIDDLDRTAKDTTPSFKGLGAAVGGFVSVLAVKQVAEYTLELAKLGAETRNVETAFNNAFGNAPQILDDLREGVKGTVSDLELMRNALIAKDLGATNEQLKTFAEFARLESVRKGVDTLQTFENILGGVLRGSTELLDNFGISLAQLNRELETLAQERLGKAASGLSALERRELSVEAATRIMNKRLADSGDIQKTNAEKVKSMDASITNLTTSIAKLIDTPVAETFDFWSEAINRFNATLNPSKQDQLIEATREHARVVAELAEKEELLATTTDAMIKEVYRNRIQFLKEDEAALLNRIKTLSEDINKTNESAEAIENNTRKVIDNAKALKTALDTVKSLGNEMFEAWKFIYDSQEEAAKAAAETRKETLQALFETNMQGIQSLAETDLEQAVATIDALLVVWENEENEKKQLLDLRKNYIRQLNEYEREQAEKTAYIISTVFEGPLSNFISDLSSATKTGAELWQNFMQNLADGISRFLASQIVKTFLAFIANLILPGSGSAVSSIASAVGGSSFSGPGLTPSSSPFPTSNFSLPAPPPISNATISSGGTIQQSIQSAYPEISTGDTIIINHPIMDKRYTEQHVMQYIERAKRRNR